MAQAGFAIIAAALLAAACARTDGPVLVLVADPPAANPPVLVQVVEPGA